MSELADDMKANALEAQKFVRKHFVVELDFSAESVDELERQFEMVEYAIEGGLSEENVELLTRTCGSYLGEVLRRHCGGEWVRQSDRTGECIALRGENQTLYPHEQVRRRLTGGPEHSIWEYFQLVRDKA
jgi:hypothetical protein